MEKRADTKGRHLDWGIVIPLLLVAAVVVFILYKNGYILGNRNHESGIEVSLDGHISYDIGAAAEDALAALNDPENQDCAEIMEGYEASQRKVSLVFCGMGSPAQIDKIIELLEEYEAPAAFFIDGMSAAENSDTVQTLSKAGYEIGSYGFEAERHWEELEPEELVTALAKTQAILRTVTDRTPNRVTANATVLNEHILHDAACAGLDTYVQPTNYLCATSFPNFSAALGYVEKISGGSILAIKLDDVLDVLEYEPMETEGRPENDMQEELVSEGGASDGEKDITVMVEYLLEALDATETAVVPLERLHTEPDVQLELLFTEQESAADYELPASEPASQSYFDHALFLGDSLTLALHYCTDIEGQAEIQAYKSVTPMQFVNNARAMDVNENEVALLDAAMGASPEKIYILLGTNAMAGGSSDSLIVYYTRLIHLLQEQFPDIPIYIQGMPPVREDVSVNRITLSNRRIRKMNVAIAKMAQEAGCYYIDLASGLADENGNLPEKFANEDGIHFNKAGCQAWLDYLLTHTASEPSDTRQEGYHRVLE